MKRRITILFWTVITWLIVIAIIGLAIEKPHWIFLAAGVGLFGCLWKHFEKQHDN